MEIPVRLKTLYKHWDKHANFLPRVESSDFDQELLKEIEKVIKERMMIYERKHNNSPQPYTSDPILQKYRFCNIYRELDRQTIEIHESLEHLQNQPELWLLNLAFNRFLCNPQTYKAVGELSFDTKNNIKVQEKLKNLPSPKYGTAYVFPISVIQRGEYPTREKFFTQYLPLSIPKVWEVIKKFDNLSVIDALPIVTKTFGYNFNFHWTEILIDVAYQFPDKINLYDEFPIGPGSIPTIKRLTSITPSLAVAELANIKLPNFPYLTYDGKKVMLSAENWEGIGCEFRKYTNLKKGDGRKRVYRER